MNKICCTCKGSKPVEDFGKHAKALDGLQSKCKLCKRLYDNEYHSNRTVKQKQSKYAKQAVRLNLGRVYIFNYLKGKSCITCGESRMPTLDFHHLRDKKFNISEGVSNGYSLDILKKEIEKCEVLCANCHRVETAKELNWYKDIE